MNADQWQGVAATAAVVVPFVLGIGQGLRRVSLIHRFKEHVQILKDLSDSGAEVAASEIKALLAIESSLLRQRETERANRRFNGGNLFLSMLLVALTAAAAAASTQWIISSYGTALLFASIPIGGLGTLFLMLITAAAFSTIYDAPLKKSPLGRLSAEQATVLRSVSAEELAAILKSRPKAESDS